MKLVHEFSDSKVRELLHVERPEPPDVALRTDLTPTKRAHISKTWRVCDYDTAVVHRLIRHAAVEVDRVLDACRQTRNERSGDEYEWGDLDSGTKERLDVLISCLRSIVTLLEDERDIGVLSHDQMVERYYSYGEQSLEEMEMEEKMAKAAGLNPGEDW